MTDSHNVTGELIQINEHLGEIANALHKLVHLGKDPMRAPRPDPDPKPESEPCIDMEHQKGYN